MSANYEKLLRERITQLRLQKGVSEHGMSLKLGKSGSYIRSISNGTALPSIRELFNIIDYFDMTPAEFFDSLEQDDSPRARLRNQIARLNEEDVEKTLLFLTWIAD